MSSWIPWRTLLSRVFGIEALVCECGLLMHVHTVVMGSATAVVLRPDANAHVEPTAQLEPELGCGGAQPVHYLDTLVDQGEEALALDLAPRVQATHHNRRSATVYGRDADGDFVLIPDAEGDVWDLRYPVFLVPPYAMHRYAGWLTTRTGLPWRLPGELEWEKAYRGAAGSGGAGGLATAPAGCCTRLHTGGLARVLGLLDRESRSPRYRACTGPRRTEPIGTPSSRAPLASSGRSGRALSFFSLQAPSIRRCLATPPFG